MLKITNFSVSVENKKILNNISLEFEAGKIYGLMGPNGSGKSSLAMSFLGHPIYTVHADSFLLAGSSMLNKPVDERVRRGLFVAFQYPQSIPGVSVFDFLKESYRAIVSKEFEIKEFKVQAVAALELVGLDGSFLYRGLNDGFSGGEKKRLEVAQLILFKPKIAILDEIDSGLDVDGIRQVAAALKEARKDNPHMCLVLITHYQRILEFLTPDVVLVLVNGEIVASGDYQFALDIEKKGYDAYQ